MSETLYLPRPSSLILFENHFLPIQEAARQRIFTVSFPLMSTPESIGKYLRPGETSSILFASYFEQPERYGESSILSEIARFAHNQDPHTNGKTIRRIDRLVAGQQLTLEDTYPHIRYQNGEVADLTNDPDKLVHILEDLTESIRAITVPITDLFTRPAVLQSSYE